MKSAEWGKHSGSTCSHMVRNTDCNTTTVKAPHTSSRAKGSPCSHTKFPPWHGGPIGNVYTACMSSIMTVAIVPKACQSQICSRPNTLSTHRFVLFARGLTRAPCQDGHGLPHYRRSKVVVGPTLFSGPLRRPRTPGPHPPSAERNRKTLRNNCRHQMLRSTAYLCRANVHETMPACAG